MLRRVERALPEPFHLTAAEITTAIRERRVSRREVLEAHLQRIDAVDGTIGAFVERRDPAAVAAGMAALGLGADYGGSIRVPASFCRVFGVRPSAGRVPHVQALDAAAGGMTLDLMNSPGPFARSLDDAWTALEVLAGAHPRDPVSLPVGFPDDAPHTVLRMSGETGAVIEPEIERELDHVCEALADAGYTVVEGGIPHARRAPELWAELVGNELLHSALPAWGETISASSRQHIEA